MEGNANSFVTSFDLNSTNERASMELTPFHALIVFEKRLAILASCITILPKFLIVFPSVVVVCHDQVRHQFNQGSCCIGGRTYELIPQDSAIDSLVTSSLAVCCKRTNVSHLVVKLHSLYRCCLVRRTPYDCCPAVGGSVLIVAVRECIVAFGSVSVRYWFPSYALIRLNKNAFKGHCCQTITNFVKK